MTAYVRFNPLAIAQAVSYIAIDIPAFLATSRHLSILSFPRHNIHGVTLHLAHVRPETSDIGDMYVAEVCVARPWNRTCEGCALSQLFLLFFPRSPDGTRELGIDAGRPECLRKTYVVSRSLRDVSIRAW